MLFKKVWHAPRRLKTAFAWHIEDYKFKEPREVINRDVEQSNKEIHASKV